MSLLGEYPSLLWCARDELASAVGNDVAIKSQDDWLLSTEFHDLEESLSEIAEDIADVFGS